MYSPRHSLQPARVREVRSTYDSVTQCVPCMLWDYSNILILCRISSVAHTVA